MTTNIRIVLVNTSHPGNIGATARAMKAMGLTNLYLVQPKKFPHAEATARAAGADDILAHATVVDSLAEALQNCKLILGTSARDRTLPTMLLHPRAAAIQIMNEAKEHQLALVFGRENNGLTNDELQQCHYHIHIPTNPDFSSLNLAAAVQIMAYEIKVAQHEVLPNNSQYDELATSEEVTALYEHLTNTLITTKFLDPQNPGKLIPRLQRFFNRARLEKTEIQIWRGILASIERFCSSR